MEAVLQEMAEMMMRKKKKEEMVLVGDTIYDIEGANLVHMRSIGVSFGFGDLNAMKEAGAICIIDDMRQLPQEVKKL